MDRFMKREILIKTNLDTHLEFLYSYYYETVSDIKEKILLEHLKCYPDMGPIELFSLKVEREGKFYHLTDSMLVWPVLSHAVGGCFYADVSRNVHVAGEDNQISNDMTEKLCLAAGQEHP